MTEPTEFKKTKSWADEILAAKDTLEQSAQAALNTKFQQSFDERFMPELLATIKDNQTTLNLEREKLVQLWGYEYMDRFTFDKTSTQFQQFCDSPKIGLNVHISVNDLGQPECIIDVPMFKEPAPGSALEKLHHAAGRFRKPSLSEVVDLLGSYLLRNVADVGTRTSLSLLELQQIIRCPKEYLYDQSEQLKAEFAKRMTEEGLYLREAAFEPCYFFGIVEPSA